MAVFLLSACAPLPPLPATAAEPAQVRSCRQWLTQFQDWTRVAGVHDAEARPVPGYVYLRVNRFLASFRHDGLTAPQWRAWLDRMQALAAAAWQVEWANLPAEERARVRQGQPAFLGRVTPPEGLRQCGARLRAWDFAQAGARAALRARAVVPDAYDPWQQAAGLYPVSALAVARGIRRWQRETAAVYATPLQALPQSGRQAVYGPTGPAPDMTPAAIASGLRASAAGPLRIPELGTAWRRRLLRQFAPYWVVDTVAAADGIGTLVWGAERVEVDVHQPTVYEYISYTRYHGEILLQLNYTVWFAARPRTSNWDLLAGHLDGITWRVTLGADGRPLLYDTIHNCGCYHLFFPTSRLRLRPQAPTLEETAFVPQQAPRAAAGLAVYVAHTTHYVRRIDATAPVPTTRYIRTEYESLRSLALPAGQGRRSVFGADGLVPSSRRLERFVLWPMGVASPGAMRQRGHHATAFVGRRHFDDAYLLERYFEAIAP